MWKSTGGQFWYSTNTNNGSGLTDAVPYEATFAQDFDGDGFVTRLGTAGNDNLQGGVGNDRFIAGGGSDTLAGGGGNNVFVFDVNSLISLVMNVDTISDFAANQDKIQLSKLAFSALSTTGGTAPTGNPLLAADFASITTAALAESAAAGAATAAIVYNTTTGHLFYNADRATTNGFGANGGQFADLTSKPILSVADFNAIA